MYEGQRSASDQEARVHSVAFGVCGSAAQCGDGVVGRRQFRLVELSRGRFRRDLNFALSGIPYWTTDIGGFVIGNPDDPAYRELFVRWFQFGTFSPILRVHGTRTTDQNELWSYGPDAQKILISYDRLRYRLLPYIYSLAWKTTSESYTPMRPLVMDFRDDRARAEHWRPIHVRPGDSW